MCAWLCGTTDKMKEKQTERESPLSGFNNNIPLTLCTSPICLFTDASCVALDWCISVENSETSTACSLEGPWERLTDCVGGCTLKGTRHKRSQNYCNILLFEREHMLMSTQLCLTWRGSWWGFKGTVHRKWKKKNSVIHSPPWNKRVLNIMKLRKTNDGSIQLV